MSKYHTILVRTQGIDSAGFQARRAGLEFRDCISIQTPEGPVFALIVRGPLEGTVVEEVVRRGRGVMAIDSCRISTTDSLDGGDTSTGRRGERYGDRPWMHDEERLAERKVEAKARVQKAEDQGRWPANLIFVHGEGCECVGTKKVKGHSGGTGNHAGNVYGAGTNQGAPVQDYVDPEGNEDVPDWDCQPDCPVALLDRQSGVLKSGVLKSGQYKEGTKGPMFRGTTKQGEATGLAIGFDNRSYAADSGGASRFFYQATNLDDLEQYLTRLTKPKDQ